MLPWLCILPIKQDSHGVAVEVGGWMGRSGRTSAGPGLHCTLVALRDGQRPPFSSRRWPTHGHGIRMSLGGSRKATTFQLISDTATARNTDLLLIKMPYLN